MKFEKSPAAIDNFTRLEPAPATLTNKIPLKEEKNQVIFGLNSSS
jgi:hypothetical protein